MFLTRPGKISFLNDYENLWNLLKRNFVILHKIFHYFEESFLKTNNMSSIEKIILYYLVDNMSREENLSLSLIQHIINQIMLLRDEQQANMVQIKSLIELLNFTKKFKINFENEYLKLSKNYYKADALKFSKNFEIREYIDYITKRFVQEQEISDILMLSKNGFVTINTILEEEFILNNMKKMIEKGFVKLIEEKDYKYLNLFYSYFKRVDKIDFIKTNFNDYIKEIGKTLIFSKVDDLIEKVIEFRKSMKIFIENSFENSNKMRPVINHAFQFFVNLKTNSIAETTSKYIDELLKKNKHKVFDENSIKIKLDEVFEIFRYLMAKDVFEAFYTKRFIKRLLLGTMISNDLETHLINKLKGGLKYHCFI